MIGGLHGLTSDSTNRLTRLSQRFPKRCWVDLISFLDPPGHDRGAIRARERPTRTGRTLCFHHAVRLGEKEQ